MRKILIFLGLLFVMLSNIYAQKGRQAIGFGLSYGTEIESLCLVNKSLNKLMSEGIWPIKK